MTKAKILMQSRSSDYCVYIKSIKIFNLFEPELQLISTKPVININFQNNDNNKCLKWCLSRYENPTDHHPATITKINKDFVRKQDFKDIKFPVKIKDSHKVEKRLHQHECFWL